MNISAKEARNISDQRKNQKSEINKMLQDELTCAIMDKIEEAANLGEYYMSIIIDCKYLPILFPLREELSNNGFYCSGCYIGSAIYELYIRWNEVK